jgi:hypothetical protein
MKKTIIALSLAMFAASSQAATITASNITTGFITLNVWNDQTNVINTDTITGAPYTFEFSVKDLCCGNGQQLTVTAYYDNVQTSSHKIYEFAVENAPTIVVPGSGDIDQDVTVKNNGGNPFFPTNETWFALDNANAATIHVLDFTLGQAWIDYSFIDSASAYNEYVYGQICLGGISCGPVPGPAVPVPAAAWLMGSGLIGLAGIARRRKN